MNRLAPLDKALVLIRVPLWLGSLAISLKTQIRGGAVAFVGLPLESPDHYPVLSSESTTRLSPTDLLTRVGLRRGDALIRMGGTDLRGMDTRDVAANSTEEAGRGHTVPLVFERDGDRHEATLELVPLSILLPMIAVCFASGASALFLLLRGKPTPMVRAYFYFAMCQAIAPGMTPGTRVEFYAWHGMFVASHFIYHPLMFRFAFLFPDDRAPGGTWNRIWPWFFGIVFGLLTYSLFTSQLNLAEVGFQLTFAFSILVMLGIATYKYRRADLIARRQMKWVVIGAYGAFTPVVVVAALTAFDPRFGSLWFLSIAAQPLLPLCLVISVVRYNLFDIDRVLTAAASYNILLVLLVGGGFVIVPRIAEAASVFAGVDPSTGQIALSLALASIVVPAHRRLRPRIDQMLFKERYALDHGIAELLPTLAECADARSLTERAGEGLNSLLRPEACVVYARVEDVFAPVFAEGRAVPSGFGLESLLVGALSERRKPLALDDAGRRPDEAPLGPFDRAALETLNAKVVLPVHQKDVLVGFICMGPKRSGDVYTSTDLSLLTVVTETLSRQLLHFDQEEVSRQAQAMQQSLRRYVPGAIAEQLSSGTDLSEGEREVTVLFVDIRGYTSFSERRGAKEIFSTVNRYTEAVSQIVQRHAGSVVEFNGDGMMAVFGAPRELAHKERAAVEAGYEIVDAVAALPVEDSAEGSTSLAVGVGIATGEAFVGNIQAVDRMIWSAIGNTTNLAARLQSLTRDLDAELVIDSVTWERAQPVAAGFQKQADVEIRGRRETLDLYVLPLLADAS